MGLQIVIDTNVLAAAFRSRRGASRRLLLLIDSGHFEMNVSVPLVLEYEDLLNRPEVRLSDEAARDVVDYLCAIGNQHHIYFLWRPYLNDPKDEMVLELRSFGSGSRVSDFGNPLVVCRGRTMRRRFAGAWWRGAAVRWQDS